MPAPKQPTDRKPKAAKSDAERTSIEFEFDGEHYAIDRERADDLELLEYVEDEQYIKAMRGYLGLEQWNRYKDSQRNEDGRVPTSAFEDFLNEIMDQIGGNSSGSATS